MDQLRAMRVFTRVIDEGSFAGAARALDLAPAVVTRLIAELEDHLGVRLIERTTRSLALTGLGERYLERVRVILADLDEAEALVQDATDEPQGHLRVMVPSAFACHQLARHLPAFHAEHPRITLTLTPSGDYAGSDELHDITILAMREPPEGDFVVRQLARSDVILCASPDYLDRHGRPAVPQDLERHQLLLPATSPPMQRELVLHHAGDGSSMRVPAPRVPLLTTAHTDTLHAAALAGLGIAGLTSLVVEQALRQGQLERVLPQWHALSIGLWMTRPARKHVPARTRAFWDFLLRTYGGGDHDPWQDPAQDPSNGRAALALSS
ncbi:LysR family transcriptional regulator [Sphaerotilus uruguayifluvii]|uniref:DNA-binding transcriptional LysR family regulator n=1 Tax=Sphaerotilus uruguayifluvii TaxID=2735897 RepID=A0ABX2G2V6_9BURK|nr:LysR family transcriptional regulator [Leptothrix sp. C29]NRT55752.1 DNA-binding transcriptional LysR family regulator [Leptothrix sp. C29]